MHRVRRGIHARSLEMHPQKIQVDVCGRHEQLGALETADRLAAAASGADARLIVAFFEFRHVLVHRARERLVQLGSELLQCARQRGERPSWIADCVLVH